MQVKVTKKPKSVLEINVVVPNTKVKEAYDELFNNLVANADIKGFRKGQAPKDIVEKNTDVSKLYGEVINKLLQTYYPQALKENHIQPIANPQVEVKEFDMGKDFEFIASVPTKPEIKIGDYKKETKKLFGEKNKLLKKENAEKLKKGEKLEPAGEHGHVHLSPDDVINGILAVTEIEIADLIIEDEAERMMSRLVNQAQSIGLSLDQYLKAQNKTSEQLKADYNKIAERNLKAEFALGELITKENIVISDEEIENTINASADENVKASLNDPTQRLYISSILAKNRLITNIISEIEKELHPETRKGENSSKAKKPTEKKEEK